MIDLHVHSTFSDGSYTPYELAQMAADAGLKAIALTDHDSTKGTDEFLAACKEEGVMGVPGVEVSAAVEKGTLHILGYFIDHEDVEFEDILIRVRRGREDRNVKMVENLSALGMELTIEEIAAYAGEDVVGRPHFAKAMIDKGYAKDKPEVFNKYLAKGQPGYAERFRLSAHECISEILRIGGVPVLSHPFTLMLGKAELKSFVAELTGMGLKGIECYYSEHTVRQTSEYLGLAEHFGLAPSGGSDFHGDANPKVKLGKGFGRLDVPDELVDRLAAMSR